MCSEKIVELEIPVTAAAHSLASELANKLKLSINDLPDYWIVRKSIDARKKNRILIRYSICIGSKPQYTGMKQLINRDIGADALSLEYGSGISPRVRPVVIGFGPAGLFAALYLTLAGLKPIILERGRKVEERQLAVDLFWQSGKLDPENNVQFGEGGAGTFSDGKLTTRIKDYRSRVVLEELVMAGAPEEILWLGKPHIGTDILRNVVVRIREKIIAAGGEVRFGCRVDQFEAENGELRGLQYSQSDGATEYLPVKYLILAVGHSARDTFEALKKAGAALAAKPFAMGMRIEHPQQLINVSQYGALANAPDLGPAEYKLAVRLPSGRSVYSFCMCPGGEVILASSELGAVATNGMSFHARNMALANSALLVNVDVSDYGSEDALAGVKFQREIEQRAYRLAGGRQAGLSQTLRSLLPESEIADNNDFSRRVIADMSEMPAEATLRPHTVECHIADLYPDYIWRSIKEALPMFDRKIHGFAWGEARLTGPETRSSSPVRILRNAKLQSETITGLYPCGEGAGYAGGIVSAAVDGIRCAQALRENI